MKAYKDKLMSASGDPEANFDDLANAQMTPDEID